LKEPEQTPYESPRHFAVIFTSELEEGKPAKLRPIRKTKATIGTVEALLQAGAAGSDVGIKKDVATLKTRSGDGKGSEPQAVAVYIVSDPKLEKELRPYQVVK
jgi:hypothetical protein